MTTSTATATSAPSGVRSALGSLTRWIERWTPSPTGSTEALVARGDLTARR